MPRCEPNAEPDKDEVGVKSVDCVTLCQLLPELLALMLADALALGRSGVPEP